MTTQFDKKTAFWSGLANFQKLLNQPKKKYLLFPDKMSIVVSNLHTTEDGKQTYTCLILNA